MIEGEEIVVETGAVVARDLTAARLGASILESGGNAADAAAAVGIAQCLLLPAQAGLAGYLGCAVVLEGGGRVWSVDADSTAPAAASEDMYAVTPRTDADPSANRDTVNQRGRGINEDEYDCHVRDDANVLGPLAVGVPGTMACIGIIHERWGRLAWPRIVQPALDMLANGLLVPGPGDVKHRPELLPTLSRIAAVGWRDMYDGELGRRIADAVQAAGGILAPQDMAGFKPRIAAPLRTTYRDAEVFAPILPNGAFTVLQALNMLEWLAPVEDEVRRWHLLAEALKLAWRDRFRYLGDPDFVDVPAARLLSKEYACGRAEDIRQYPLDVDRRPSTGGDGAHGTFHVSTADVEGNVVSMTLSHGGGFGSQFIAGDTGLVLGHGMCRFDPRPGRPNSVAGGKRPLNNACPLIVRFPNRDVGVGLGGGRRIVSVTVEMVRNLIERSATGLQAARAPRLHVCGQEPVELTGSAGAAVRDGLSALGHRVKTVRSLAGPASCAEVLPKQHKVRAGGGNWAVGL